jgi:hypothetical protein
MSDQNYPAPMWRQVSPFQTVEEIRRPNVVRGNEYSARVPKLPFQYYLDPSGNLVRLAVGSTRNFQGAVEAGGDPLRSVKFNQARALKDGFIPWEFVDAKTQAPWLVANMDRAQWEVHREKLLQERRGEYNAKSSSHNEQYTASETRKADAMVNALNAAVEKKFGEAPPPKTGNPFGRRGKPEAE